MIFGYPSKAIEENWFHECLMDMLDSIHEAVQNGSTLQEWPNIVPEKHREELRRKTGLKSRLNDYYTAVKELSFAEIQRVKTVVKTQSQIEKLLSGSCNCKTIDDLPSEIREPVRKLFDYSFGLLSDLQIRDHQYQVIYDLTTQHICPFCGCEYFDAPGAPREALDHYLPKSIYPFAAANLLNLVPMGHKCNSKYKLAEDILFDESGVRRKSFFPYRFQDKIQIDLDQSVPFAT